MFYIAEVQGCEPDVAILLGEDGTPEAFDSKVEAEAYAKENCAWEWRVVEF